MAAREYRQLSCRDVGVDCDFLVRAETEDELWELASAHGARMHGVKEISPDMRIKIKSAIKTVLI